VLFSYDIKQFLRKDETKDIYENIRLHYPDVSVIKRSPTNKIRTNKELASFIKNLFEIGSDNSNLNYDNITVEYFCERESVLRYIDDLQRVEGWKAISFTTSRYEKEPLDNVAGISDTTAHAVIGQEFKKVVVVMDSNFRYNEQGKLQTSRSYYSAFGMLYQIVTRVVDELKIIVLGNPELFSKLLEIKHGLFINRKIQDSI